MIRWVPYGALVSVLVALGATARAGTDYIVIEAYDEARPKADANRFVYPVRAELEARGFLDGPEVTVEYLRRQPWRMALEEPEAVAHLVEDAENGIKAFREGRFPEAADQLVRVKATAERSPLALATDATLRMSYRKTLAALAMAKRRLGDEEAAAVVMAELARSFPDVPLTQKDFGSEAAKLANAVKAELPATGALSISVDQASASIYINERRVGNGQVQADHLVAGQYRVLVRQGNAARLYLLDVVEGQTTTRRILFDVDSVMGMTAWAGFTFPDTTARVKQLPERVASLGAVLGARAVVVLTLEDVAGRRRLSAATYLAGQRNPQQTDSLQLEPPPSGSAIDEFARDFAERARELAMDSGSEPASGAAGHRSTARVVLGVGGLTIGLAAGAGSAYLLSKHGDCRNDACDDKRETLLPGIAIGVGAAALVAVGTYLITHSWRSSPVVPIAYDSGAGLTIVGAF
jgi:hypothetical protein